MPWQYGVRIRRPKPEASQSRTSPRAAAPRWSGRGSTTQSSRSARQRPGQQRRERGRGDQPQRAASPRAARSAATTGATRRRSAAHELAASQVLVEVGPRGVVRRVDAVLHAGEVAAAEQRVVAARGAAGRAARGTRRGRAARPARGRTGAGGRSRRTPGPPPTVASAAVSGRSIRPTWSTKTRVGAELDGAAERDRVHDAAVEVVLVADLGRRQQPGYGGAGDHRVDDPAAGRTSARRRARCWPRRPGSGPAAPRR